MWMTPKPLSTNARSELNYSVTNRLGKHPFKITSAVKYGVLSLTAENLDTGVIYERQLKATEARKILSKIFENDIEKLLMEVTLDRKTNSLHVPGLNTYELEALQT